MLTTTDVVTANLIIVPFQTRSFECHGLVESKTDSTTSTSHRNLLIGRKSARVGTAKQVSTTSAACLQRGDLASLHVSASRRVHAAQVERSDLHVLHHTTAIRTLRWTVSALAGITPVLNRVVFVRFGGLVGFEAEAEVWEWECQWGFWFVCQVWIFIFWRYCLILRVMKSDWVCVWWSVMERMRENERRKIFRLVFHSFLLTLLHNDKTPLSLYHEYPSLIKITKFKKSLSHIFMKVKREWDLRTRERSVFEKKIFSLRSTRTKRHRPWVWMWTFPKSWRSPFSPSASFLYRPSLS